MTQGRSAGTIFWGLTLVGIGVLLLLRNLGYAIPIWTGLAIYWPVLVIVWGLLKLVDYFRFRSGGLQRPLFSGGEVALLIMVLMVGSAFTTAANVSPGFGNFISFADFDFFDVTGNNFHFAERVESEAEAGSTIEIQNVYGSVDVRPAEGNRIIVEVDKNVRAEDHAVAERLSKDFKFTVSGGGSTYRIASNRDDFPERDRRRYRSNLMVQVPKQASVRLVNRYGAVTVADLTGDQTLETKYAATTVRNITGSVRIDDGYGAVDVQGVSANVDVVNRYASVTVRDVGGRAGVENKYGSVHLSNIAGGATVSNRYSSVSAENVTGELRIEGGNNGVDVDRVNGPVSIQTSYKNIDLRNPAGSLTLNNRHGDIRIVFDEAPKADITITGEYADVDIEMPASASFSVDARTRSGELDSDFEGLSGDRSGRERRLSGQHGAGGPRISIETTHGDVQLSRRG